MGEITSIEFAIETFVFVSLIVLSFFIGRRTDQILRMILLRTWGNQGEQIYDNIIGPVKKSVNNLSLLILCYLSTLWFSYAIQPEEGDRIPFFDIAAFILDPFVYIIFFSFISRLFHRFLRSFGIDMMMRVSSESTEFLLAIEIVFNIVLWTAAFIIFGLTHGIPMTGVLAGASIGGLAVSFAAQNTLSQLLGTIILFLDRPFVTNEHIRLPDGTLGRVESIGLRSTKIRAVAKGTLLIIPNSKMADWQIENVTRGRKVMVLIHMDFDHALEEYEKALVRQVITRHINSFYGIENDTSSVDFFLHPEKETSRARVIFFILGSTESSIDLRRRLVSMTDKNIATELEANHISYTSNDPVVSFDSPMPI